MIIFTHHIFFNQYNIILKTAVANCCWKTLSLNPAIVSLVFYQLFFSGKNELATCQAHRGYHPIIYRRK